MKIMLSLGLALGLMSTAACGKSDCEDGYERIKAKYDDCRIEVPSTISAPSDDECTDREGESLQNLADTVENGTCDDLRALSGSN
jgi:hypothetical protein